MANAQKNSPNSNISYFLIGAACIVILAAAITPLLMIAKYNYPSADDWSHAVKTYQAAGDGLFEVLKAAWETVRINYHTWEGRYANVFLASLQPGIWGEKYYGCVTWLLLGSLIFSEFYLCGSLLCLLGEKKNLWLLIPVMAPGLLLQILYCPFPEESFYWYTGAVNYTFIYGLSLILTALFLRLAYGDKSAKRKTVPLYALACLLAVLVGGDNYATSLSCFLTLLLLNVFLFPKSRKIFFRMCPITLLEGAGMFVCILSPANQVRLEANFAGASNSPLWAIVMSLVRSLTNIYSWTNPKVLFMLLFILPFVWKGVGSMNFGFRLPGLFTLFTFGLYASQITATLYIDGTTGGGRMAAILYYSYYIWLIGNTCYWIGWIAKRRSRLRDALERIHFKLENHILMYCTAIGLLTAGVICISGLKETTSYKAYRNWRQGWAAQYAAEWEERLNVLHDDGIREVTFLPLSVHPEMLMYTDLQKEDGYLWVNDACALYYGKDFVRIED